jgi:hypothetical protein
MTAADERPLLDGRAVRKIAWEPRPWKSRMISQAACIRHSAEFTLPISGAEPNHRLLGRNGRRPIVLNRAAMFGISVVQR